METIKRINRDALKAAQEAAGETGSEYGGNNNQMIMYLVAIAVAIGGYFLLKNYQPEFVMSVSGDNGTKQFDETRAMIASAIAGLVVILVYNLMQ